MGTAAVLGTESTRASHWQEEHRFLCCGPNRNLLEFGRASCAQMMPNARDAWQTPTFKLRSRKQGVSGFLQKATSPDGQSGIVSYILARACHRPLRFVIVSKKEIVQELGNDVR